MRSRFGTVRERRGLPYRLRIFQLTQAQPNYRLSLSLGGNWQPILATEGRRSQGGHTPGKSCSLDAI
jgi:hypothetical protein